MEDRTERNARDLREGLDDSWFDRPEHRAVADELRQRIARLNWRYATIPSRAAHPGLDDSWFR